jgi:hypothetical protein
MSRNRSAPLKAADTARNSGWAVLLDMAFASGTLRLCVGPWNLSHDSNTYFVSRSMLKVERHDESVDGLEGLSFSMSGLDPAVFALVATEPYRGVVVRMLEQRFDADHALVEVPKVEYVGRIVAMSSTENAKNRTHTVTVQTEHYDAQARRSVNLRFSDAEQKRRYPGDKGAEYVTILTERVLQRRART